MIMNSNTQKGMLLAIVLVSIGVFGVIYFSPNNDGGQTTRSSGFQPGSPHIVQSNSGGAIPKWSIQDIFENGRKSLRYGRAVLVWPNGDEMEWKGDSLLPRLSMCDLKVEYFASTDTIPSTVKTDANDDIVKGECQPRTQIDFELLLTRVIQNPMDEVVPYAAFEGFNIEIQDGDAPPRRVSPIAFGIELRTAFLRDEPLKLMSSNQETYRDSIVRFQ